MPPYEGDTLCVFHNSAHRGDTHRRAHRVLGVDMYPLADSCSAGVGCHLYLPLNIVRSECICREVVPGLRTADGDTLDVLLSLCAVAQHGRSLDDFAGRIFGSLCCDRPAEAVDLVLQHAAAVRRIQVCGRDRQFLVIEGGPAACSGPAAGVRHLDLPVDVPGGKHTCGDRIALCGVVDGIFCVRRSTVFPPAQLCRYLPNGAGQVVRFRVAQAPRKVDGKALVGRGPAGGRQIRQPDSRALELHRGIPAARLCAGTGRDHDLPFHAGVGSVGNKPCVEVDVCVGSGHTDGSPCAGAFCPILEVRIRYGERSVDGFLRRDIPGKTVVKPFFDRRVGWGIAGWRDLARMGLDRRIGHMVRAVHPKLGSACLVLGRNTDLAREIASAPYPAGGNLPFGAVPARACNLPKDQAEGVRRMAVHRKYGCGIKDLAGRHRRLIKKQPAPVRLVCTQVVDAQLTHTAGQILQILRTVAIYGILSHVSTPSFYRRTSPMRTVIFSFSSMRLMATYVSMSSTLKMFWLLSTKVAPPPCADIKARDCSAV